MKKILIFTLTAACTFSLIASGAWAQASDSDEFTLEEIVVTSEKREVVIQEIPSSVAVIEGATIVQQGKITTQQILESVPNIKWEGGFANPGVTAAYSDGGIAIRGVKRKQTSDGQPPSSTAVYVDGVFQGIGGSYDVNRVEILRGPQGTLYGRSATGGVVGFYTHNPKLGQFGYSVSAEIGEANLRNFQAALNAPYGDEFAIRLAGHHVEQDGYYNPDGGHYRKSEGRIKALWKPSDAFDIMLTGSLSDLQNNTGGYSARLITPTEVDYKDVVTDVVESGVKRSTMGVLTVNYDFGKSILTYIGAMHHYEDTDSPPETVVVVGRQIRYGYQPNFGENFNTSELRLASDSEGWLKWLIGANYYNSDYDRFQSSINHRAFITQLGGIPDPDPATNDAPLFDKPGSGETTNIGFFTEETFELTDAFRITAGLRYDKTKVDASTAFNLNVNHNEWGNARNPAEWSYFGLDDTLNFDNITYKLRFEYDLTPNNMLYALTATGFQPGDLRLSPKMSFGPDGTTVTFLSLPYDEEKLTSYEIGSKNRFFDNRLQVNAGAFFYNYEGYRLTANIALAGPPVYAVLPLDLEMIGAELTVDWLLTAYDMLSFSLGLVRAEITGYPDIPELNPTKQYAPEKRLHGIPDATATLSYNHTFNFSNGSTLVPRAEVRYTSDVYVNREPMTEGHIEEGLKPYAYQDAYFVADIGATWTSPGGMYSATAYVRNLFDEEYKLVAITNSGINGVGVTMGDPRAWGLVLSTKF